MSDFLLTDGPLQLRRMGPDDAAAVHRCRNLPEVARYQGWRPERVADVVALAHEQARRLPGHQSEPCQLVIVWNGVVVGDLGFGSVEPRRQVELGIVLDPAVWGQGLATRALRLLITHLFADGFHRVKARVDPRNTASLRLFDRLGFRREGHERLCYWDAEHGEWTDEVLFAVLSSEWRRQVLPSAHQPLGDECGP